MQGVFTNYSPRKSKLPLSKSKKLHRTLQILHIIQLECHYQKVPFYADCHDNNALMEKYLRLAIVLVV